MKSAQILCLISLCSVGTAFASDFSPKDMPANLKCYAKMQGVAPGFKIEKLNTKQPEATISDTSMLDYTVGNNVVEVSFSNECDNGYGLVFFTTDLIKLKKKEIKKLTGILNYSNADMYEGMPEAERERAPSDLTTVVTCTL